MKDLWSNFETANRILSLDPFEKRNFLIDVVQDTDMVNQLDDSELDDLVYDEIDLLRNVDEEEFFDYWVPFISGQTFLGTVLLAGARDECVMAHDIVDPDWIPSVDEVGLVEDDGNLLVELDEQELCQMYAIPKDKEGLIVFIKNCMPGAIDDKEEELYWEFEDDAEFLKNELIDKSIEAVIDEIRNGEANHYVNDYCDFAKVPSFCELIKAPVDDASIVDYNESINETINITDENKDDLQAELEEIEADYNDFGPDGFYAIPLNQFATEFPNFYNEIILSFLSQYLDMDPEAEDPDELDDMWASGELILPEDWPALFDGVKDGVNRANKGRSKSQWEKIYPKFVKSPN